MQSEQELGGRAGQWRCSMARNHLAVTLRKIGLIIIVAVVFNLDHKIRFQIHGGCVVRGMPASAAVQSVTRPSRTDVTPPADKHASELDPSGMLANVDK